MRVHFEGRSGKRWARLFLIAHVHLDALRRAPWLYIQGVGWRIRGLKLRARHRLSALKGHSPYAYALWITTRERELQTNSAKGDDQNTCDGKRLPSITIVIDCRTRGDGLSETLRSISEAIQAIGSRERTGAQVILLGTHDATDVVPTTVFKLSDTRALAEHLSQLVHDNCHGRPWILTMKPGDRLAPLALNIYRAAIRAQSLGRLFYADDDIIDVKGLRSAPHFKPQWNVELARHHDFLSDSCLFACDPACIGHEWPRGAFPVEGTPIHVPHVLHHRRDRHAPIIPASTGSASQLEAATLPNVSVIVPTRDRVELLRTCIEGLAATRYPSFDVIVIDNDSTESVTLNYLAELAAGGVQVLCHQGPFNFAAMHNQAVALARGPLLCLLNNDVEISDPDWLSVMVRSALREDVGAVGARLLYPDRTIQHAGIVTGIGGGAAHAHRFQPDDAPGYFCRAHLPQFVSAVTAACLVVSKDRFEAVGGFDADNFAVAFNDVDLCLKLNARGWQSFYEPRATLIHHESRSRGTDYRGAKKVRFAGELAALKKIWRTDESTDPYHHSELSPFSEQFVVRL